jgi:hypothetical protein
VVDDKGQAEIRQTVVLDTNPERAVLASGVDVGELVVVSPMERSRVAIPLKVLDVNDPKTVIVDPPEPEWMKRAREGAKKDEKKERRGLFGRKKKDDDKKSDEDADKKEGEESTNETDEVAKADASNDESGE